MQYHRTSPLVEKKLTAQNPKESISCPSLTSKRIPKNVLQVFIKAATGLSSLNFPQKLSFQILLLLALLTPCSPVFSASVLVSWDSNTESDLAGYKLYKRALPTQNFGQPIFLGFPSNPSSPSTTVTGLSEGTTYGFILKAFDTSGNESAPSVEKQLTLTSNQAPKGVINTPSSNQTITQGDPKALLAVTEVFTFVVSMLPEMRV